MTAKPVMRGLDDVLDQYTGRSRTVLEYAMITKRIVDEAKTPGFSAGSWAPLAELVAVDEFTRVGPFKEVMNWDDYVAFLTNWAASSEWECSFKRITEVSGVVFLELEERSRVGEFSSVVNSLSVYEFTDTGKIGHIDVYLQMAPQGGMLQSLEGFQTSE